MSSIVPLHAIHAFLDMNSYAFLFVSCGYLHSSFAGTYTNIQRSYIGNNFEFEVLGVPIWHCI